MSKRWGWIMFLPLFGMLLSQEAFGQEAQQSPLVSPECSAGFSQELLIPADAPAVMPADLPELTPKPTPRSTYLCGSCSRGGCAGGFEGDPCMIGNETGMCYASFAQYCSPTRHYCDCFQVVSAR